MGAVGLNTAGRTEVPCIGLNRDTNELKPPFGHLPSPSLVECVFACHSLPSLSPTYSKEIWEFSPRLANSSGTSHTLLPPWIQDLILPFFCFPSAISLASQSPYQEAPKIYVGFPLMWARSVNMAKSPAVWAGYSPCVTCLICIWSYVQQSHIQKPPQKKKWRRLVTTYIAKQEHIRTGDLSMSA